MVRIKWHRNEISELINFVKFWSQAITLNRLQPNMTSGFNCNSSFYEAPRTYCWYSIIKPLFPHSRLNQLKTSGEEEWKRRVGKKDDLICPQDAAVVKLREKPGNSVARPSSIADRLNQIETAKTTWRGRVEETDVKRFTVAGRLASRSHLLHSNRWGLIEYIISLSLLSG